MLDEPTRRSCLSSGLRSSNGGGGGTFGGGGGGFADYGEDLMNRPSFEDETDDDDY